MMLRPVLSSLAGLVVLISCSQPPADPPFTTYSVRDFLSTVNYRGGSFSSDSKRILVSHDSTGVFDLYAITIGSRSVTPLLAPDSISRYGVCWFPGDDRFLFTADHNGDENYQLFVAQSGGAARNLTPESGQTARFLSWAGDEKSFFLVTNARDKRYFDVIEQEITPDYPKKPLFINTSGVEPAVVSPDRRFVAVMKADARDDIKMMVWDTRESKMRPLLSEGGKKVCIPQAFSNDGRFLYYLTDENHEFLYLARLDLETNEVRVLVKTNWDVEYASLSHSGRYLAVAFNKDAISQLSVFETDTMLETELPKMTNSEITSVEFNKTEDRVAFYASGSRTPNDLFVTDMKGSVPVQLSRSLSRSIHPSHLVESETVRFASYDSLEIPGLLYKPVLASPESPVPAIVLVHGGPGGQSRVGYSGLIQFLVNQGYAVYAINHRGSGGYGKTFYALDNGKHGKGDLEDCVYSKHLLARTGWIDTSRVAIMGGSYGGYLTLAALAFRPTSFSAGVNLFGVSNWVRTLQNIPPYWESYRKALESEFGTFSDEAYLRSISPLFHAHAIVRPLMVIQGANDQRVLRIESDEIVEAVRKRDVPVEYLIFDDEGHGIIRKENRIVAYEGILAFLNRHVRGDRPR